MQYNANKNDGESNASSSLDKHFRQLLALYAYLYIIKYKYLKGETCVFEQKLLYM